MFLRIIFRDIQSEFLKLLCVYRPFTGDIIMDDNKEFYEYKIKPGDTFSGIIFHMFGQTTSDSRYQTSKQHLLALNPKITDPNFIRAGDVLRLGLLPPVLHPAKENLPQVIKSTPTVYPEPGVITS